MGGTANSTRAPSVGYEERYVSYVDILGFSAIVESSKADAGHVTRLHHALARLSTKPSASSPNTKLEATNFSDMVVVSAPVNPQGLAAVLDAVGGFGVDLLSMRMLLRGAIIRGHILHSSDVTFGPALIEAYKLERDTSFHPRIMLAPNVVLDVERYRKQGDWGERLENLIVTGNHDVPYLNPFAAWEGNEISAADFEKLVTLQTIIAGGLMENARFPSICEKYKWLARKLNAFVQHRKLANRIAVIDID